jgi:hypothetical protein
MLSLLALHVGRTVNDNATSLLALKIRAVQGTQDASG